MPLQVNTIDLTPKLAKQLSQKMQIGSQIFTKIENI